MVDTRERLESVESTAAMVERMAYEAALGAPAEIDVDSIWEAVRQFNNRGDC